MFRGNHPTRVDEKGRLKLPAEFKHLVDERYGTQFYITSKDGRRAEIYPLPEGEKIEAKLALLSPTICATCVCCPPLSSVTDVLPPTALL